MRKNSSSDEKRESITKSIVSVGNDKWFIGLKRLYVSTVSCESLTQKKDNFAMGNRKKLRIAKKVIKKKITEESSSNSENDEDEDEKNQKKSLPDNNSDKISDD